MATTLTLGGFTFDRMEVPEEIDPLGIQQKLVVHNFPGGVRTVQEFGGFPPDTISWSGNLMNWDNSDGGQNIDVNDRINQLTQMTKDGAGVSLSFAMFTYMVVIHKFYCRPKLEWWIPYTIELVPYLDQSVGGLSSSQPASPFADLSGMLTTSLPGTISTGNSVSGIQASAGGITSGLTSALGSLTAFQSALAGAMQAATTPKQANTPAVQSSLITAQASIAPFTNSSDPGLSAFGFNAGQTLTSMGQQLNPQPGNITQLNTLNPDLMLLAQQYYGDFNQWTAIANANVDANNNRIITPNPIGFYNLNIPAQVA